MPGAMKYPATPSDESWSAAVQEAYERYHAAAACYGRLLKTDAEAGGGNSDQPLALARIAASEAMAEYTWLLKIVAELKGRGRGM